MNNIKGDLLTLASMDEYQAPDLPTLEACKPELLEKVPSRWKNKAIAATAAGLFGMTSLTGCSIARLVTDNPPIDFWTDDWMHHGGAGGTPMYVVQLTEQEAIGIIRAQLEEVGLLFDAPKKSYHVTIDWNTAEVILVNEEEDIRIALVDRWWVWNGDERRIEFTERAIKQFGYEFDIGVDHVIFNMEDEVWTRADEPERREELEEELIQQVQAFIEQLREEGIIE